MMRRLLAAQSGSIAGGAFILAISGVASRLLGLVRDRLFAGMFGAGDTLDAYYAAFRIPDTLYGILIVGALSAALIPVFVREHRASPDRGWTVINNALGAGMFVLALAAAALAVAAPAVMDYVVAPGFEGEKRALAVTLTRIMLVSPILLGASGIVGGALQALHRFVGFAIAPVFYNAGIIAGAVVLVPAMGPAGLAWGVVAGAALHLAIQLPGLRGSSYAFRPFIKPLTAGLREVLRLMVPRAIGVAAHQINFVVVTAIASTLAVGSVTIFNFADGIHYFPVGVIGISFALAAFPRLSEAFASGSVEQFRRHVVQTLRVVLYLVLPAAFLFVVLRREIVELVLGGRAFTPEAAGLTAAAVVLFSLNMAAQAVIPLFARAFYARHDTKTPVVVGVASMAANALLALMFVRLFSDGLASIARVAGAADGGQLAVLGLPLAASVAGAFNAMMLFVLLRRKLSGPRLSAALPLSVMTGAAAVAAFAAWVLLGGIWDRAAPAGFWDAFVRLVVVGGGGLAAYWALTYVLKMPEASVRRLLRTWRDSPQ